MAVVLAVVVAPTTIMTAIQVMAMAAAIQVRMVRRMVTLARRQRLHLPPHNQSHRSLASDQASNTNNPAQGCAGLLFFNGIFCPHH